MPASAWLPAPDLPARAAVTWSSNVDLPMPGSPPISTAEPGTRPPPVARSNSSMRVRRRSAASAVPVRPTKSSLRPLPPPRPLGAASRGASSVIEFQAPQASQRPLHLVWLAPQAWQT